MTGLRAEIVGVLDREPWLTSSEIAARLGRIDASDFRAVLKTSAIAVTFDGRKFLFALANDCSARAISALVDLAEVQVTPPDWREPYMTPEDYYAA